MNQRILLASPHMGGGEMKYIEEAFQTNWVAPLGANVTGFEADLATYTGVPGVVALSSGTAALHLAMILAGVGPEDTVFCQDLTFSASVNPVLYQHARPAFIDSEGESWNLDPTLIRKGIERYGVPKALINGSIAELQSTEKLLERPRDAVTRWSLSAFCRKITSEGVQRGLASRRA